MMKNVYPAPCKVPIILTDFNKFEFPEHIFEKYIKFHANLSSGSRVFPCGRTDWETDRRTDITNLIVANEPEHLNSFSPISPADMTNICIVFWSSQLCVAVQNHRTM